MSGVFEDHCLSINGGRYDSWWFPGYLYIFSFSLFFLFGLVCFRFDVCTPTLLYLGMVSRERTKRNRVIGWDGIDGV